MLSAAISLIFISTKQPTDVKISDTASKGKYVKPRRSEQNTSCNRKHPTHLNLTPSLQKAETMSKLTQSPEKNEERGCQCISLWGGELLSGTPKEKDAGRRHGRGALICCLTPLRAELSTLQASKKPQGTVDNLKPWARVGLKSLFFNILFCAQHSLSQLDSEEVNGTLHSSSEE